MFYNVMMCKSRCWPYFWSQRAECCMSSSWRQNHKKRNMQQMPGKGIDTCAYNYTNTCTMRVHTVAWYWNLIKQFVSALPSTVAPAEVRLRRSVPCLPAIKPDRLKAAKTLVEKAVRVSMCAGQTSQHRCTHPHHPFMCCVSRLTLSTSLLLILSWGKCFRCRDPTLWSVLPYGPEGG